MGFGLLFIGYLLAFGFSSGANYIVSIIGIAGAIFLFAASCKLSIYSKSFVFAKLFSVVLALSYFANPISSYIYSDVPTVPVIIISKSVKALVIISAFAFNFFMYKGVDEIARTAENTKLQISAKRDMILMIVYYFSIAAAAISSTIFQSVSNIFSLMSAVLGVTWLLLSIILTLSAYMRICLSGDEDMPLHNKNK